MTVHEKLRAPGEPPEGQQTRGAAGYSSHFAGVRRRAVSAWGWSRDRAWPWARFNPVKAGLAAILILGALYYGLFVAGGSSAQPLLAPVQRGDVENTVTALGSLQPRDYVDVGAQVSGQLKSIAVEVGDEVKKGQFLAEIDSAVATAKVRSDEAQLQNYQSQLSDRLAQLQLAIAQAERQERLRAANATSQNDYDAAIATRKSAEAQVKVTQAQIAQAQSTLQADQATLGYSKIYAPMDGTVASVAAKVGQTLNANQSAPTILQIADLSVMTVSTQVSEADVPKLTVGMEVYFTTLGAPNRRWSGTLRQIEPTPTVVNSVVLYTALFDVENPNRTLMTQMTAQVFFVLGAARDVLTVPLSAVKFTGGGTGRGTRGAGRPAGQSAASEDPDASARTTPGENRQAGDGQGMTDDARAERRRAFRERREAQGAESRPQPRNATVDVVTTLGTETRQVTVGVTNRVSAEILSGLKEGEQVVAGQRVATAARDRTQNQNQRGGRGGSGGIGGFGGGFR